MVVLAVPSCRRRKTKASPQRRFGGETATSLTAKEMVQVTSALLAIAAAAAGLAGVATETRAPTLARTLA